MGDTNLQGEERIINGDWGAIGILYMITVGATKGLGSGFNPGYRNPYPVKFGG